MRPSLLILLLLLLFLSLGSSSTYVGCGSAGVSGSAAFGCSSGSGDDPCDYIVTLQVTVLLEADGSPIQGATVTIDTSPPDSISTDAAGRVFWNDTAFLTGFYADCGGQDVGTVEPSKSDTSFTYDLFVTASGLAPAGTVFTITRETRDIILSFRLSP